VGALECLASRKYRRLCSGEVGRLTAFGCPSAMAGLRGRGYTITRRGVERTGTQQGGGGRL
jgi:hypothetical protein